MICGLPVNVLRSCRFSVFFFAVLRRREMELDSFRATD